MVSLDRCSGNCNNPYGRICVANKTEDTSLNEFNMIEKINESKTGFDFEVWLWTAFEVLSWKIILSQPYVGWARVKTYSPTNFLFAQIQQF